MAKTSTLKDFASIGGCSYHRISQNAVVKSGHKFWNCDGFLCESYGDKRQGKWVLTVAGFCLDGMIQRGNGIIREREKETSVASSRRKENTIVNPEVSQRRIRER